MKVAVFDMHGIIFSFSSKGDISESSKILDERVKELSLQNHRFAKALEDTNVYLEAELKIVKEILSRRSDLCIYGMDGSMDKLLELYVEGYHIVIVSTSKTETSRMILEYLLRRKNDVRGSYQIVYSFDIYNSQDFGDKSEKSMWKEVFSRYDNIDMIYEDKMKYLEAAREAAQELDFEPKCFTVV